MSLILIKSIRKGHTLFLFCFMGGIPGNTRELLLALTGITSGSAQQTIWDAKDQTQVVPYPSKCLTCFIISTPPKFTLY